MKKYRIFGIIAILIVSIFTINVKALSTSSGEYPDLPNDPEYYVILENNSNTYAYILQSESDLSIVSNQLTVYSAATYQLDGDSWGNDTGSENSVSFTKIIVTTNNIVENGEVVYSSGYGLPIPGLFSSITDVITNVLTAFATVALTLIDNSIFQIMFGIVILFICIGLVYGLVAKVRRRGR